MLNDSRIRISASWACMKATVSTAVQKYIPSCKTNGPILWAVMCAMCIPLESISQEKDRYRESVCDGEYEVSSNVIAPKSTTPQDQSQVPVPCLLANLSKMG